MKVERKSVLIAIVIFSLLLLTSSTYLTSAFFISDTFKMKGEITTGGHVNLTNISGGAIKNISRIAIGQPIIGNASGGPYRICFGVFCTDTFQPYYSMNFTGTLKYSNGSVVANAPIKVTTLYLNSQFSELNRTNGTGFFFVKLDKLPEYMMYKDLNITFYVQGDIEAIYKCYYNYTERCCCRIPFSPYCYAQKYCPT